MKFSDRSPREDFSGAQTKALRFKYDVFDRRIARELDTTSPYNYTDAAIERCVNHGDDVALVFDGTGALTHRVLHNPDMIDQILADEQFDPTQAGEMPTAAGQVYWPLQDHQNSVRQMVNSSGAVVWSATYDAFGNATIGNPQNIDALFAYTGRELDNDLGLYYYRARWYDPAIGRFASEDPIGFSAGTPNLSEYVGNSPTNGTDPSGMFSDFLAWWITVFNGENGRAGKLDRQRAENQMREAQAAPPISFMESSRFRSIQLSGAAEAKRDMQMLGKTGVQVNAAGFGGAFVGPSAALRSKLSALESAQQTAARTRTLSDGRIRYYRAETPARTSGPTRGASICTEYNPKTGQVRQWMESYDHLGNVVRVRPKMIDGQQVISPHFPPTGRELGQ